MFLISINLVVSGALQPAGYSVNHLIYGFTQNAYWILAAPTVAIGVFAFDKSLKMLWVCLAIFTMLVTPVTVYLLRSIDFDQISEAVRIERERKMEE